MKSISPKTIFLATIIMAIGAYSCHQFVGQGFRQHYTDVNKFLHQDSTEIPFFKVHLKNGDVSLMEKWHLNNSKDSIYGEGTLYDYNRELSHTGQLVFRLDNIAIIETNQTSQIRSMDNGRVAVLSILTAANVALSIICIANPKACFGSCPTFYLEGEDNIHQAKAEGFSSSILPSLEKADIDALGLSTSSTAFSLTLKNEALETHMINEVEIHAVEKETNESVFHDKHGRYHIAAPSIRPKTAMVGKNDILASVSKIDRTEYFSKTDENDLSSKEELILEYENLHGENLGIVINFRQTLVSTFLLYSGISYMGDEVSDYMAKIETSGFLQKKLKHPFKRLGGLEFYTWNEKGNEWVFQDYLYETGPISKNLIVVPLKKQHPTEGHLKVKIKASKGLWRYDYIGVSELHSIARPISVHPSSMDIIDGEAYTIDHLAHGDEEYLISFPGNEFKLHFEFPPANGNKDYELFLESKGYYLEWNRHQWIAGKNKTKLKKMFLGDEETWRELAQEFKTMEHKMEEVFWNSRFTRIQ